MNDTLRDFIQDQPRRKAFDIVPSQDPLTNAILQARREVVTDPDLSDGSKVLFCLLLDWSLWPGKNVKPGVVTISTTKLHELLCRSKRAIYDWKKELLQKGCIWITLHFLPNCNPMHTFHISAIDPQEHGGKPVTPDGLWGNGSRRQGFENPGIGARGNTQRWLRAGKTVLCGKKEHLSESAKSGISEENETGSRKKGALSAAKFATGSRKICDGESQSLRRAVAESATGSRTKQHLAAAQNSTCQPHETAPIRETQGRDLSTSEVRGGPLPTEKQFQDWLKSLDGLYPSRLRDLEKTFTIKLRSAQSPEAKAEWKRRLEIVQERLLGGPVEDKGPKPVRVDRKPAMTFEQRKKAWEAAKKDLPDQLRKKAAGGSAART